MGLLCKESMSTSLITSEGFKARGRSEAPLAPLAPRGVASAEDRVAADADSDISPAAEQCPTVQRVWPVGTCNWTDMDWLCASYMVSAFNMRMCIANRDTALCEFRCPGTSKGCKRTCQVRHIGLRQRMGLLGCVFKFDTLSDYHGRIVVR